MCSFSFEMEVKHFGTVERWGGKISEHTFETIIQINLEKYLKKSNNVVFNSS